MNFTTAEIAHLLGTGHHGPARGVERVVIDPNDVGVGARQLFAASAHPPPLGDTTLVLEDDVALRVPYLTERSWVGGTAVNGPSTEAILRAMAGDERGRPDAAPLIGVLGATAPWVTAALVRAALDDAPPDGRLPPSGPPDRREPPGTERFRMPLALLNHADDSPLAVVLNRRHRGCSGADAALLAPTMVVISDLGDRDLATLGSTGASTSAREVLDRLDPDSMLVMSEAVTDTLRDDADIDATRWRGLTTFRVRSQHADPPGVDTLEVGGPWGELEVDVGDTPGGLALPVGAAIAVGLAAGRHAETVRSSVEAAAQALTRSMVTRLAEGPIVWDRSDATSFGDVSEAIAALAERSAPAKFLVLGPLDDGPTVTDRLHARLGVLATRDQIVVRSAEAWGSGFSLFEHPQNEVDDLAAAGPGAVVLLAGGGAELHSVRRRLLERARVST